MKMEFHAWDMDNEDTQSVCYGSKYEDTGRQTKNRWPILKR